MSGGIHWWKQSWGWYPCHSCCQETYSADGGAHLMDGWAGNQEAADRSRGKQEMATSWRPSTCCPAPMRGRKESAWFANVLPPPAVSRSWCHRYGTVWQRSWCIWSNSGGIWFFCPSCHGLSLVHFTTCVVLDNVGLLPGLVIILLQAYECVTWSSAQQTTLLVSFSNKIFMTLHWNFCPSVITHCEHVVALSYHHPRFPC